VEHLFVGWRARFRVIRKQSRRVRQVNWVGVGVLVQVIATCVANRIPAQPTCEERVVPTRATESEYSKSRTTQKNIYIFFTVSLDNSAQRLYTIIVRRFSLWDQRDRRRGTGEIKEAGECSSYEPYGLLILPNVVPILCKAG